MLYGPGVRCGIITDEEYTPDPEYIAIKISQRLEWERELNAIPDPPSFLFEWDEKRDIEDMTGLTNINLTS